MIQDISQMPLAERIPALANAVTSLRAAQANTQAELARVTALLAQAEAEVTGKAPGSEGVALSGLIDDNPYLASTPRAAKAGEQGDAQDPATGEGSGGTP